MYLGDLPFIGLPMTVNRRRRILIIALASWAVVAMRSRKTNPFSAALHVGKVGGKVIHRAYKISFPIAKLPFKILSGILKLFFGSKHHH